MAKTVLVTGGAGFIGSHLADQLLRKGWDVRALDCLAEQVHGPGRQRPEYLAPEVDLRVGDVRDPGAVRDALEGVDAVVHLAAAVGVGQSMYQIASYTSVNALGTAVLLEALAEKDVGRLVVASSMSLYGEGRYVAPDGTIRDEADRGRDQLEAGGWDPVGPDGEALTPIATPEDKRPTVALRPRGRPRGHDVARSCVLALERDDVDGVALNVGSGRTSSVAGIAALLGQVLGTSIAPEITGQCRMGDIRHCFADVSMAERVLGFRAQVSLEDGLAELGDWLAGRDALDRSDQMRKELEERGLTL